MESGRRPTGLEEGDWQLVFDDWAVGQAAAVNGHLDFDFDEAALVEYLGRPLLPAGWTIAHEAAKRGLLPEDFGQWDLATTQGLTVLDVALHAELPPMPGFPPRTREEIDDLKRGWKEDPCWDIEHTEGFEAHVAELRTFRQACDAESSARYEKKIAQFGETNLGVKDNPALVKYIISLQDRIAKLEDKIEQLGEIIVENGLNQKGHKPRF
jgi:hypothetical protein